MFAKSNGGLLNGYRQLCSFVAGRLGHNGNFGGRPQSIERPVLNESNRDISLPDAPKEWRIK